MPFELATAGRIVFGSGTRRDLGTVLAGLGRKVFIVGGQSRRHEAWLTPLLGDVQMEHVTLSVSDEPVLDTVRAGAMVARDNGCDVVLGLGGGSAIDMAKAVAAMATQPSDVLEYLEVIGRGRPLVAPPLPCVAVPTTAGTGSEVTKNAVIGSPEHRVKASLRSPAMLPRAAIVDPELTLSLPRDVTAATGLDALAQLVEPFVSTKRQPLTDALCRAALASIGPAIRTACDRPDDLKAREAMSFASLCSGMALANAGLGAVHGFAGPIGGMFPAPHGAVCAVLLPGVMEANIAAARSLGDDDVLGRYTEIARVLTNAPSAAPEDGAAWVRALVQDLAIPPLSSFGVTPAVIQELVGTAKTTSSMKGNPLPLSDDTLTAILRQATDR